MDQFAQGLLLGLALQLSVGPVCLSVLQTGINGSFWSAFALVWGVAIVDGLYIVLALLGVSGVMQVPGTRMIVGLAGAALLVYFGVKNLRTSHADLEHAATRRSLRGSLRYGLLLTLSNPLTILFWGAVFGGYVAAADFTSPWMAYLFGAGCVTSTLVFLTGVAALGRFVGTCVRPPVAVWLNRVTGLFLIGFAIKLALGVFEA